MNLRLFSSIHLSAAYMGVENQRISCYVFVVALKQKKNTPLSSLEKKKHTKLLVHWKIWDDKVIIGYNFLIRNCSIIIIWVYTNTCGYILNVVVGRGESVRLSIAALAKRLLYVRTKNNLNQFAYKFHPRNQPA